jgi:aminoglycoside phosphotransferase family enzyme/predicted kinase
MAETPQDAAIHWLGDPANHGGQAVERVETHGAMVFLAGDRAFKIKRAVHLPYFDFSTLALRQAACAAELRLNRRTAPQLYLRLVALRRQGDGRLALGDAGEPVEWVIEMQRFDQACLLERVAAEGRLTPAMATALASTIARFHATAERRGNGSAHMARVLEGNTGALRDRAAVLDRGDVESFHRRSSALLAHLAPLLDRRAEQGFVRRCHGDLHLGNILLLEGGPVLFDALEFDEDLASIDVLYDLSFLLMDLLHRGANGLANLVLNTWCEATGDYDGLAALPLFLALRAGIRAHIRALRAGEGDGDAGEDAQRLLREGLAYLDPPPAPVIAVGGLSGSGKSTLARALAPRVGPAPGAIVLRSDVVRKRLAGIGALERLPPDSYTPERSAAVYAALLDAAARVAATGHGVIVDAVHARPGERDAVEAVARRSGRRFAGLWLTAPADTLSRRVDARRDDASDANAAVVARQLGYDTGPMSWTRLDSSGGIEAVTDLALAASGLART